MMARISKLSLKSCKSTDNVKIWPENEFLPWLGASFASYTNITVYDDEMAYPDEKIEKLGKMRWVFI